jgi:hypothetical protein
MDKKIAKLLEQILNLFMHSNTRPKGWNGLPPTLHPFRCCAGLGIFFSLCSVNIYKCIPLLLSGFGFALFYFLLIVCTLF